MAKKKRLLILTNRFHPQLGGAELNIFYQAQEFSKHFEVDVLTPLRDRDPRVERLPEMTIYRALDLHQIGKGYPNLRGKTLCPAAFTRVLSGGYDVVHCFPAVNRNNMLALEAARLRGTPVFLSNFDLFDYAELISGDFDPAEYAKLQLPPRQAAYLARFKAIFTISERETRLIEPANPNAFLSTVPIKLEEFDETHDLAAFRRQIDVGPEVPIILCLSRVSKLKGQDMLLKSVPLLKERTADFVVVIVGRTDYEPEYLQQMQDFVRQHGLEDHVRFTGPLERVDAVAALKACAVHVLPMRFMNSGAVVIESWAAGRPVLQSERIDPNYIEEGENGFTFRLEDTPGLADRLASMLADPAELDRMGRNGRALVERKFLYPQLIEQYMRAYEQYS